jgi:hypothetical protein
MIVIIAIAIALVVFFAIRALTAPRVYAPPQMPTYVEPPYGQPGAVFVEPSPMADIGTMIAADVAANVITDIAMDAFDSGPMDGGGFDGGGFGDGF